MKKSDRISALVAGLGTDSRLALHPCYQGYFTCFNAQQYYEAHDVLEHLWLASRDENSHYFKGLIQLAGAFVHLQKQFLRPHHAKDGRRLRPAMRLFQLARFNLAPYTPQRLRLDVGAVIRLADEYAGAITASDFQVNPWQPESAPQLALEGTT